MPKLLTTCRFLLKSFVESDARHLVTLNRDPDVLRYVGAPLQQTEQDYRHLISTTYHEYDLRYRSLGFWSIWDRADDTFLGWVCMRPASDARFAQAAGFLPGDIELGYRLRKSSWGRGVATEVSRCVVDSGFTAGEVVRVVASALAENRAPTRVMEKVGLKRQYEYDVEGFVSRGVVYAQTREEWEIQKSA